MENISCNTSVGESFWWKYIRYGIKNTDSEKKE